MAQPSHDARNALGWSRVSPCACARIIVMPTAPPLVGKGATRALERSIPPALISRRGSDLAIEQGRGTLARVEGSAARCPAVKLPPAAAPPAPGAPPRARPGRAY